MPNRPERYVDKERFRKTRNAQRKRYYQKTQKYIGRRLWTPEEDKLVLMHKYSDTELSSKIQRSVSAIQQRRWRLNMLL